MSESKFKKGDKVSHKSEPKFNMVVIDNGNYKTTDKISKTKWGKTNPLSYICKYYNPDTTIWEEKFFYEEELELS
jgi:hypothetical protein